MCLYLYIAYRTRMVCCFDNFIYLSVFCSSFLIFLASRHTFVSTNRLRMQKIKVFIIAAAVLLSGCASDESKIQTDAFSSGPFVKVEGTRFEIGGEPYYYVGANFWYGINLGSKGEGGNRERLIRELDRMEKIGITNLRIMGMSEGPDNEPYRMVPAVQKDKALFREELLEGLDFLLTEMGKRKIYAIVCLSNFWPWSGGFGQYVQWTRPQDTIPYPPPHPNGSYDMYQKFVASFYTNKEAIALYNAALDKVLLRKNSITQRFYKDDPTIMAWELCNEPRGVDNFEAYLKWIDSSARYIKSVAPNQLVTVGSEGETGSPEYSGTDFEKTHAFDHIDYTTVHIWIQNWDWYNPKKHTETFPNASAKALDYLKRHAILAKKMNKPYVLEEFGIMKDQGSFDPNASTKNRDVYYELLFKEVYNYAKDSSMAAGVNFWAWGGEGRPRQMQGWWKPGDDFIGDPPHEEQGWYSVYDTDTSTNALIKKYADLMMQIGKK